MMKTQNQLKQFDMADFLQNEEDIAEYLSVVLEENDSVEFLHALGTVAKAKSMTQIAQKTGLNRESLYKALSSETSPKFDTISKVLAALDLKISITPKTAF